MDAPPRWWTLPLQCGLDNDVLDTLPEHDGRQITSRASVDNRDSRVVDAQHRPGSVNAAEGHECQLR
jgi:hypothetical protein